jgi:hypothetical protein
LSRRGSVADQVAADEFGLLERPEIGAGSTSTRFEPPVEGRDRELVDQDRRLEATADERQEGSQSLLPGEGGGLHRHGDRQRPTQAESGGVSSAAAFNEFCARAISASVGMK